MYIKLRRNAQETSNRVICWGGSERDRWSMSMGGTLLADSSLCKPSN